MKPILINLDSGSITPGIITIILTKILHPKWSRRLCYLVKKLSLSLEILGVMACLGLVLKLVLIRSFWLFKRAAGIP